MKKLILMILGLTISASNALAGQIQWEVTTNYFGTDPVGTMEARCTGSLFYTCISSAGYHHARNGRDSGNSEIFDERCDWIGSPPTTCIGEETP
jgi:hypothetical protein